MTQKQTSDYQTGENFDDSEDNPAVAALPLLTTPLQFDTLDDGLYHIYPNDERFDPKIGEVYAVKYARLFVLSPKLARLLRDVRHHIDLSSDDGLALSHEIGKVLNLLQG